MRGLVVLANGLLGRELLMVARPACTRCGTGGHFAHLDVAAQVDQLAGLVERRTVQSRGSTSTSLGAGSWTSIAAIGWISAETGRTLWIHEQRAATMSLVATGGGLVFGGDVNGRFRALDQETGAVLWEINLGSPVTGFPISYAAGGRQYVAVSTGSAATASGFIGLTPELRPSAGNNLFVFALPDGD